MYKVLTLNNIALAGLRRFPRERYEVASEITHPDAIILRSYNMHEMDIPPTVVAVGRAGADVGLHLRVLAFNPAFQLAEFVLEAGAGLDGERAVVRHRNSSRTQATAQAPPRKGRARPALRRAVQGRSGRPNGI